MVDRVEKLLEKFRNSPNSISIQEVIYFLTYKRYKLDRIRGSHFIFTCKHKDPLAIPSHNGKVKRSYIKKLINMQL